MADSFSRRGVLRAAGLAAGAGLSGCLLDNPRTAAGHVYVENASGVDRRIALVIAERTDGTVEREVAAWYRIPNGHALEFETVLERDRRHVIHGTLPDAPPSDEVTFVSHPCPADESGERIVVVDVQRDGLGVVPRDCEQSYTQRELEYVPASEYRLEPYDGEIPGR
ncbi:hypothetical protein NDI56_12990 [Haloarcula sp. S1CR25-12]|uniref:Tat pathway signal protein n=1 Tax=Haloarcula saliterrae TaxID=2950534 RepID=A0ABU2FEE2_9EURY|nr:hypothetical protein [Haloarcula sp. S1CR25-12]MDS0260313.1 hypothetical protein [Haloarcula sp. S1CR25-12]